MWPDRKLAVAISVNNESVLPMSHTAVVAQIAREVAEARTPVAAVERVGTRAERRALVGHYRYPDAPVVAILEAVGALQMRGTVTVFLVGYDRSVIGRPDRSVEKIVLRDAKGNVKFMHTQSRASMQLRQRSACERLMSTRRRLTRLTRTR